MCTFDHKFKTERKKGEGEEGKQRKKEAPACLGVCQCVPTLPGRPGPGPVTTAGVSQAGTRVAAMRGSSRGRGGMGQPGVSGRGAEVG